MNKAPEQQPEPDLGQEPEQDMDESVPNWETPCCHCDELPTVDDSQLCGPCFFGEADAIDWYDQ